ncbi:MAG: A/G-specific adenine glycosylase [Firmicutes bacterium]|nr:A/G-specific adenine glycosylase [Bacillota bacterium]
MQNRGLNNKKASGWCRKLLSWYDDHRRDLPWRNESDPYKIWLSEVMLQQTRVETALPYYKRFISEYPTLQKLALAEEGRVLKLWEGLGYYARARHFLQAVREVDCQYGGRVPDTAKEFGGLAGVGEYTQAAVLSIAYHQPLAVVDGNVRRVLCRLFAITEDTSKVKMQREMQRIAQHLLDPSRPGDYNQAIMELGALICIPRAPRCEQCPVAKLCEGRKAGIAAALPVKKKKKVLPIKQYTAVVLLQAQKCLIRCRKERLLHGLWEFPNVVTSDDTDVELSSLLSTPVTLAKDVFQLTHEFSHLRWQISIVLGETTGEVQPQGDGWRWVTVEEMDVLPFPAVYQPVVKMVQKKLRDN